MTTGEAQPRMTMYLGERYMPGSDADDARSDTDRICAAAEALAADGSSARLLSSTFVLAEEWMLDLFEGDTLAEVERVYAAAGMPAVRVSAALHVPRADLLATPADPTQSMPLVGWADPGGPA
jgi:hypothetical protein